MMFAAGTKLGRYEIRSKLGEGGMGEVYVAQDTQLGRPVAIKILPPELAQDQQRLLRFLQEARAASALNHPNVAHIYEIGEAGGVYLIAMEYVEGRSLYEKLGGRPLPTLEILEIGIQIADALDEAHAKGITHRDIKTQNIMITPRDRVKVLDFGLAKVSVSDTPSGQTSDSENATRVKTSPGMVMGTVSYMSPEQAMGREIDHRSDIFSLGVVLYEMATGRLPFAGETVTETIDRLAHSQPEAIARLNYEIPAELEVIVKKALRKDRDERYQRTHDLLIDLRDLKRELDLAAGMDRSIPPAAKSAGFASAPSARVTTTGAAAHGSASQTRSSPAAHRSSGAELIVSGIKQHKTGALLIAGVAFVVVAVLGIGLYRLGASRNPADATKAAKRMTPLNMKITRLTANGKARNAAISPDGRYVVYVVKEGERQSLWLRQVATSSNVQIIPPADVQYNNQTFSPDGNYVYYVVTEPSNSTGALYQAPVLGGSPRRILINIGSPIAFSPGGERFAFVRNDNAASGEDQLMVANADGTGQQKLAVRRGDKWFSYGGPAWSPDGRIIACGAGSYSGGLHMSVITVEAETGTQRESMSQRWLSVGRVAWLADGRGLVIDAADPGAILSQIWSLSYPDGEAAKITNDLNSYLGPSLTADSKALVTVQEDWSSNIWIGASSDASHAKQITAGKLEGNTGLAWTPDGRIVYTSFASGNLDIWIVNRDGTNQKQLTTDPLTDNEPNVSADGRYVVFVSYRSGFPSLWRMDIDGANLKQLTSGQEDSDPQISPDSRWIVFQSWRSGRRIPWRVSIDGGEPIKLSDKFVERTSISPDGKLIACLYTDEQPNSPLRLMVMPFEGGPALKTFDVPTTINILSALSWTPDGRAITYIDTRETSNLWSQPLEGGHAKPLTNYKENGVWQRAWSQNGKQLALTRGTIKTDVVLIRDFK